MDFESTTTKIGFGRHLWDIRAVQLLSSSHSQASLQNLYLLSCRANQNIAPLVKWRYLCLSYQLRQNIYFTALPPDLQTRPYNATGRQCRPPVHHRSLYSHHWDRNHVNCHLQRPDPTLYSQFCKDYAKPVVVMNAVINVATEFYILVLPTPCVMKLQITIRRRIGLLLVFASGLV